MWGRVPTQKWPEAADIPPFFLRPSSDTEQLSDHKRDNDKIQQQFKCIVFEVSKRFTGTKKTYELKNCQS